MTLTEGPAAETASLTAPFSRFSGLPLAFGVPSEDTEATGRFQSAGPWQTRHKKTGR